MIRKINSQCPDLSLNDVERVMFCYLVGVGSSQKQFDC